MAYSHILITRPAEDSAELAGILASQPARVLSLPAYEFRECEPFSDQLKRFETSAAGDGRPLVIFTSPRAVEHGLANLPVALLSRCRVAAIGPTTAQRLLEAGIASALKSERGYTSEDLLEAIPQHAEGAADAFIVTAPGGRSALVDGLRQLGYRPQLVLVYERKPAELDEGVVEALRQAVAVLSVWTSADAIRSLSQRLPADAWQRLCEGDWIVISDRLARVARSFHPARVSVAAGPTNAEIAAAVEAHTGPA